MDLGEADHSRLQNHYARLRETKTMRMYKHRMISEASKSCLDL